MRVSELDLLRSRIPDRPGLRARGELADFVVFIPLVPRNGEYHLLFEKRARSIRQGGEISFPGGAFEPAVDRDREEAVLRETVEEIGVQSARLSILGRLDSVINHAGALITPFVGTVDASSLQDFKPNPQEVDRLFLSPLSYFEKNEPERYEIGVEMQPFRIDERGNRVVTFPARELGLPERYWGPWRSRAHTVSLFRCDGEAIWGLTAELVLSLVALLR